MSVQECGGVVSSRVLRDRAGSSKQAGFVQMASKEAADAAVEQLHGQEVSSHWLLAHSVHFPPASLALSLFSLATLGQM